MKKSDLKKLEEIARREDENFSIDDIKPRDFVKEIDRYLPEHLRRFKDMTEEEIEAAVAAPDFFEKEKERFEELYKPLCDQIFEEEQENSRTMEAELNTSELSDRDRLMFNVDRLFPEFRQRYNDGTLDSDAEFSRKLRRLIEFGESIGEDPMSELIFRMNLK